MTQYCVIENTVIIRGFIKGIIKGDFYDCKIIENYVSSMCNSIISYSARNFNTSFSLSVLSSCS